jgi:hypothetical protein
MSQQRNARRQVSALYRAVPTALHCAAVCEPCCAVYTVLCAPVTCCAVLCAVLSSTAPALSAAALSRWRRR